MFDYEGESKSFRPDQLYKMSQIKQLCYFSIQSPFISTHTYTDTLTSQQMALYISLAEFFICRGFCMSGRKLLDPSSYILTIYFGATGVISRSYSEGTPKETRAGLICINK